MRNPARKAVYLLLALLAGAALVWFGAGREQRIGEHWTAILPIVVGLGIAPFALVFLIQALFAIRGRALLLAGHGAIARWHVYPAEWEQFRGLDRRRAAANPAFGNDLWVRKATPRDPVEVIVGETSLLVDGSYHVLQPGGLPELREVRWLEGPPLCLEFALLYPRSRYGGTVPMTLRVPVPASARGEARRVFAHFEPRLRRRPGLALRNPPGTYRACATLLAGAGAMMAIGYFVGRTAEDSSSQLLSLGLLIGGAGLAAFALILASIVWLATRPG